VILDWREFDLSKETDFLLVRSQPKWSFVLIVRATLPPGFAACYGVLSRHSLGQPKRSFLMSLRQ
jgi:hypothetical protein